MPPTIPTQLAVRILAVGSLVIWRQKSKIRRLREINLTQKHQVEYLIHLLESNYVALSEFDMIALKAISEEYSKN